MLSSLARVAIGAGAASVAWAATMGVNDFRVRFTSTRALAPGSNPVRVLHLSDIHLAPWQEHKIAWLQTLAELEPDLVVNTGDNVGHSEALPLLRTALGPLAGVPGVFVHGSNDFFKPSPRNPLVYLLGPSKSHREPSVLDVGQMDSFFSDRLGWHALDNTALTLDVVGNRLDFIGLGDSHHGRDDADAMRAAHTRLGEVSAGTSTIGVTHAPYSHTLNDLVADAADVLFAGHTHGGQVCLPNGRALVTNCDLPVEQARGLSLWHAPQATVPLHVSGGIGTSIYAPVRLFCAPEATVVTLLPRIAD